MSEPVSLLSPTLRMRLQAELRKRGLTVSDFVRELENKYRKRFKIPGYNHILRVVKGETYPGPNLLPLLCEFLGIDLQEARQMVLRDKGINNGTAQAFTKKDSQLLRLENIWATLSADSKAELVLIAEMKSKLDIAR